MKIYVVETIGDYCYQIGFSSSKQVAEEKCKELNKKNKTQNYWVTTYTLGKNNWTEFEDC